MPAIHFIQRRRPPGAYRSSRHCRSVSCASMSISRSLDWRRKRDRYDDDRDVAVPAKPVPQRHRRSRRPHRRHHGAGQDHRRRAAAGRLHDGRIEKPHRRCAAAGRPPPPVQQVSIPAPPPPPAEKPVETAQPAPQVERVSHQAEDEPSDSPIGDWQTEGRVRCGSQVRQCAVRPCARFIATRRARRS